MKGLSEIEVLNSRISQDLFEFISSLQMNQARHRREVLALLEKLPEDHKLYGKTLVKFFTDKFHNDVGTHLHHVRNMTGEITCLTYKLKGDMETFTSTLPLLLPVPFLPVCQHTPPCKQCPICPTCPTPPTTQHQKHWKGRRINTLIFPPPLPLLPALLTSPWSRTWSRTCRTWRSRVGGVGVEAVAGEEHIIETSSPVSPDAVGAPTSTDTAEALAPAPEAAEPPPPGVEIELSSDNSSSSSTGAEPDQEYQVNYSRAG